MRRGARTGGALLICLVLTAGCGQTTEPAGSPLPYDFRDATASSGLDAFRQVNGSAEKPFIVETVGAGLALLDHDRDGDLDAYLTNGSRIGGFPSGEEPHDALYANDGSGHFTDATDDAGLGHTGWTNGVRVADVQGDGWPDLFLTCYGPNVLLRNDGAGRFEDVSADAGVGHPGWGTGACFLDFDNDGDLDLYVANYVDFDEEVMVAARPTIVYKGIEVMKGPRGLPGAADVFYVADGRGGFRDASNEMGIDGPEAFGFQCIAFDANEDGWVDVYVANDSVQNLLWRNRAGAGFVDVALRSGLAASMAGRPQAGMGVGIGDFDGDLVVDLYVTNFADDYHTLYRGTGRGFFVDSTQRMRLSEPTKFLLGWGCGFADLDNDGDQELWAANGHVYPQADLFQQGTRYRQPNQVFELAERGFRVPAGKGGPGFAIEKCSRGAAVGDVDGDGDLDLLVGNIDDTPTLLRNDSESGHWLLVELVGAGGNRDAVGARLVATVGERRMLRLAGTAGSFLSSSDPRLHFGLGGAERVDSLEVRWPNGDVETFHDLAADRQFRIEQGAGPDGTARLSSE